MTCPNFFSQRYGKAPLLDEIEGHENVGVAWDHMTVSPKTWPLIAKVYPIMKEVFSEEFNDMREKREVYSLSQNNIVETC